MITKYHFLVGLVGVGVSGAYYRYHESHNLELTHKRIGLGGPSGRRPLRLLHLSDLHASRRRSMALAERAVELGLRTRPDLICVTGDFVTHRLKNFDTYSGILRRLSASAPTYACLGNHDGGRWAATRGGYKDGRKITRLLTSSGVRVLNNASHVFDGSDQAFRIVAMADLWSGEMDPDRAFDGPKSARELPTLVLAHNPDAKSLLSSYAWDLLLCGHTHGGQVVLPVIGPVISPVDDRRFMRGLHTWRGRKIHVTRGVGSILGIRLNCRPEVSLLEIS
ncbi:MAG: phosphodiesterase YaeI [Verrucomicrobiota bacterium]